MILDINKHGELDNIYKMSTTNHNPCKCVIIQYFILQFVGKLEIYVTRFHLVK
jgi:hypothetical protein